MRRWYMQLLSTVMLNGYVAGFINRINYGGKLKAVCVPALNCWSCPSALTSCPLGVIQSFAKNKAMPLVPLLMVFVPALFFGRFFCGFICPFGYFQDIVYTAKTKKIKMANALNALPAVTLVFGIFILPYVFSNAWFSKYLCPAGTLQAGIPWVLLDPSVRATIDLVFYYKLIFLAGSLILMLVTYRFFCRALCPLGLIFGIFNKIAFVRIRHEKDGCGQCDRCRDICPVGLKVPEQVNDFRCIRCMKCVTVCPDKHLKV